MILQLLVVSLFGGALLLTTVPPVPPGELGQDPGPPGESVCRRAAPKAPNITELADAGLKGRYPGADISRGLRSTRSFWSEYINARKDTCDCYRGKPPASTIQFNETEGAKGPRHFIQLQDTCPPIGGVFSFPTSVFYNKEQCWVLKPWAGLNCPYKTCRYGNCRGVRPTSSFSFSFCQPTNFKCKVYFIWCPKSFRIYKRYVCLPHCCSCMYMSCFLPSDGAVGKRE